MKTTHKFCYIVVIFFTLIVSGPSYAFEVRVPCDIPGLGATQVHGDHKICWSATFKEVKKNSLSYTVTNSIPLASIGCGESTLLAIEQGDGRVCGKGQSVFIKLLQPQCSSCETLEEEVCKKRLIAGRKFRETRIMVELYKLINVPESLELANEMEKTLPKMRELYERSGTREVEDQIDIWGIFEVVPVPCKEKEEKKDIKIESKEVTSSKSAERDLKISTERFKRIMANGNTKGGNGKNPDKCIVQPIFPTSGDTETEPNLYSLESPNAKSNATGDTYLSMPTPSSTLQFTEKGVLPGVELQDAYSGLASS